MRARFEDFAPGDASHGDVCIVGSGPAGVTLAVALARAGRRVVLLEAGGEEWSDESQDIYRGRVIGDDYFALDAARLRYLGGTSNHWAGWSRPLDPVDFTFKDYAPLAHWPIDHAALDPYRAQAEKILELPPLAPPEIVDPVRGLERVHFAFSPPVRFWRKFGPELEAGTNVRVLANANVTLVRTDGRRVTGLQVQDYSGAQIDVRARTYVLATGGIENSRLMLWSNAVQNGVLVRQADMLGRCWMEHPHHTLGAGLVPAYYARPGGFENRHFLSLTERAQRQLGVLNCGLRLEPLRAEDARDLAHDLACAAPDLGRQTLGALEANRVCGARLRAAWEQGPDPANRVTLSASETDRFGVPLTELHWKKRRADLRTAHESALALAGSLAATGMGRLKLVPWLLDLETPEGGEIGGKHHMGGTRMADTPARGVVDADCRVFGQENLYVAGSSVFATGGHANPTQTIVQLALRLAGHLTG